MVSSIVCFCLSLGTRTLDFTQSTRFQLHRDSKTHLESVVHHDLPLRVNCFFKLHRIQVKSFRVTFRSFFVIFTKHFFMCQFVIIRLKTQPVFVDEIPDTLGFHVFRLHIIEISVIEISVSTHTFYKKLVY